MRTFSRVNPAVKLLTLLAASLALLAVFDPWTPTMIYLALLVAALVDRSVPLRTLVIGQLPFAAFAISLVLVNGFTRTGHPVLPLGGFTLSREGLAIGASLGMRTLVVGVGVLVLIRTTSPPAFIDSMRQNLRLPDRVCFALLAGYRILQELPRQWRTLVHAHAVRRPHQRRRDGTPKLPVVFALRACISLLAVAIRRGERLTITMETRGLGSGPRTSWRPSPIGTRDLLVAAAMLVAFAALIALSAALGLLRGPSVL